LKPLPVKAKARCFADCLFMAYPSDD